MRMIEQQTGHVTIEDMIAIEPRIGALLNQANIPTDEPYWHRYSHFKRLLSQYVGWNATRLELMSCACYETMIAVLCKALANERREKKS